jgi:hypothetical protein
VQLLKPARFESVPQREMWQPWAVGNISGDEYAYLMRLPRLGNRHRLSIFAICPGQMHAAFAVCHPERYTESNKQE